jgi:hypothetical protein
VEVNVVSIDVGLFGKGPFPGVSFFKKVSSAGFLSYRDLLDISAKKALLNGSAMLPSVLYNIDNKSAIAFHWNMRGFVSNRVSNTLLSDALTSSIQADAPGITLSGELLQTYFQNWVEYNFTYARTLLNKNGHQLNGGLTFKFLQGIAHSTLEVTNIQMQIADENTLTNVRSNFLLNYNQGLEDLVDGNYFRLKGDPGVAFDVGFEYKRLPSGNPTTEFPYSYKVGFSLVDIGFITNKNVSGSGNVLMTADNVQTTSLSGISSIRGLVDTLQSVFDIEVTPVDDIRQPLPLSMFLSFDKPLGKYFFVHLNSLFTFVGNNRYLSTRDNLYRLTATPRFENKNFGVYLPLTFDSATKFNTGVALRWKPFIIGSSNLLTRYFYRENEVTGDFYVIIKIPIAGKASAQH